MKTFKQLSEQMDPAAAAKKKLQSMKGKEVSFTHQASGDKHTGTYKGMKSMGGRSYAHVEVPGKGAFRIPPHHIHQTRVSEQNNRFVIGEASDESMSKAAQASKDHGHDYHNFRGELKKIAHHMDAGHDYKTAVSKANSGVQPSTSPKSSHTASNPSKLAHKAATGTGHIHVHSNYEDGHGKVNVHVHNTKSGEKKSFTVHHGYAEDHGDKMPTANAHNEFKNHLSTKHGLSSDHASAVAHHIRGVTSDEGHKKYGVKHGDSTKSGYTVHSIHNS